MFHPSPTNTAPPPGFIVVDLETTTNREGKIKASDGNEIVALAARGCVYPVTAAPHTYMAMGDKLRILVNEFKVMVGHNIKFDLEYLRTYPQTIIVNDVTVSAWDHISSGKATILDTQFITYLHSGHAMLFPSLEESCKYWGIPVTKTLDLAVELPKWDFDIRKIPKLDEYLLNDIEMTTLLINKQLKDPWVIENFAWILKMHEGLLGTFEIEYNGTHVDPKRLWDVTASVQSSHKEAEDILRGMVAAVYPDLAPHFEFTSNDHVAAYIFGGDIEIKERVPNGVYASGKKIGTTKYKVVHRTFALSGWQKVVPASWRTPGGKISVSEDVLIELDCPFTRKLMEYRELSKLKGTYLEGLSKHLRIKDGAYYVFPQINTCATATGRTSSSKPNMQNNPTHDSVGVASIYTSRYGEKGTLVEVDFKQIEVLALAVLSGDQQLVDDILNGRDIHAETGKPVFGSKMTKEQRRVIKTINFGLIYGGAAKTLAIQAKVPKAVAAKAINSFYERYPDTKLYFDVMKASIQTQLDHMGTVTGVIEHGIGQKALTWTSDTGRRYTFKDYYSDYAKKMEVSHTQTRNYPIQGLATGDLVLCALGDVMRKTLRSLPEGVKLIGLVHDSLRFDVMLDKVDDLMASLKYVLEEAGNSLNKACKEEVWNLPIKVTFSKGDNFFDMKELD